MPHHVAICRLCQEQMGFVNDESVENDIASELYNCSTPIGMDDGIKGDENNWSLAGNGGVFTADYLKPDVHCLQMPNPVI